MIVCKECYTEYDEVQGGCPYCALENANKTIERHWLEYYTTSGRCDVCANTGVIEPVPIPAGKTYCFCPNGRAMREQQARI